MNVTKTLNYELGKGRGTSLSVLERDLGTPIDRLRHCPSWLKGGLSVVLAAGLAAGCGAADKPVEGGAIATTEASSSAAFPTSADVTVTGGELSKIDMCKLLAKEQIAAAIGVAATSVQDCTREAPVFFGSQAKLINGADWRIEGTQKVSRLH